MSLVGAIDDATGLVAWACFRAQEDAQGYFEMLRETVRRKGVPLALYSDRHGIFFKTKDKELSLEEQFDGRRQPTQFGRLLEELGIQLILARSPQAKGRVERLWGTFQDRLTSELRLARASTREAAQQVLARFLPRHKRRFSVPANDSTPAWLPAPDRRRHDRCSVSNIGRSSATTTASATMGVASTFHQAARGRVMPRRRWSSSSSSTARSPSTSRAPA